MNQFSRTELLIGEEGLKKLHNSKVLIFGVGGVGGYVVEALARSGVGTLDLVDNDEVALTNINRQIVATLDVIGEPKVQVFKNRIQSISLDTQVNTHQVFYLPENSGDFDFTKYDYVVDAIDTVAAKLDIIQKCHDCGTPIISAMGCGNRMDPTKLVVTDIFKTETDPLAKVIRKGLRERGIKKLKVVASTEQPLKPLESDEVTSKRTVPGSTAFVPPAAGLIIAAEVVKDLLAN